MTSRRIWIIGFAAFVLVVVAAVLTMGVSSPSDDQLRALAEQTIPHGDARLVGQHLGLPKVKIVPSDHLKIICGWIAASLETKPKFFYVLVSTWPWLRVEESYLEGGVMPKNGAGMSYFCGDAGDAQGKRAAP